MALALCLLSFFLLRPALESGANLEAPSTSLPGASESADGARLIVDVREENGTASSGLATVSLQHLSGETLSSGLTNGGRVIFENLGPGEYTVVVILPGYVAATESVNISPANQQEQVYVVLKREADPRTASAPAGPPLLSPKLQKELSTGTEALNAGKLDIARKHLDEAYRLAPANPEVNYMCGLVSDRQGDTAAAQTHWQKTISLDPKHALALLALSTLLARKGDYSGAKRYLERALEADPNSWHAHELFSVVSFRQGAYQDAIAHAERSLELGKDLANGARLLLAQALIAQQEDDRAADALTAFLKTNPTPAQTAAAKRMLQSLRAVGAPASPVLSNASASSVQPVSLAELPLLKPELPRWLPADIDDSVPVVDAGVACPLQEVLDGAAKRVQGFTSSVDRFTATEFLDHQIVNQWGFPIREEKRSFNYMVSISEIRPGYLSVDEYRNGAQDLSVFPDSIATTGLPAAVLVFHPYYRDDYEMSCEGLGRWGSGRAWQVHFAQKPGKRSRLRRHRAGIDGRSTPIALKGRAWIDESTFQVVRVETDLQAPMPEIKLLAEHMDIEFGPVQFRNQEETMWLPMTAGIYFDLRGRRIRRKSTFRDFLLFSVSEKQTISAPREAGSSQGLVPPPGATAPP